VSRFARYGWIVVSDLINEAHEHRCVGVLGPRNVSPEIKELLTCNDETRINLALMHKLEIMEWRCLDSDGEVYYEGLYAGYGDGDMFGPLNDFCQPDAGAVEIQYRRSKQEEWRTL
jgi:hypothetical protein